MSTKYSYFDIRVRDQPRIVLCVAGVEFEDFRPTFETWKGGIKQNFSAYFASATLPAFDESEVGQINESSCIIRHLARKYKLEGSNEKERTQADIILTQMIDLRESLLPYCKVTSTGGKADERAKWLEETAPGIVGRYEGLLARNNGGKGYFVGEAISIADLAIYDIIYGWVRSLDRQILAKFPLLEAHRVRLNQLPGIQKYIQTRPKIILPPFAVVDICSKEEECVQD